MFAALPHSHLIGRKIRLKHIRNGTELPSEIADETYDFNYQVRKETQPLIQK